jgi:hypothetical protein
MTKHTGVSHQQVLEVHTKRTGLIAKKRSKTAPPFCLVLAGNAIRWCGETVKPGTRVAMGLGRSQETRVHHSFAIRKVRSTVS